jgi:hypothetical protein
MCNWVKNSHGNSEKIAQFCVENEKDAEEEEGSIYIAPSPSPPVVVFNWL